MKLFVVIFSLFSLGLFSQSPKIKIQKEKQKPSLIQSESPWHVTFCNYYNGSIKLTDLYNSKNKLKVSNNIVDLKIISFELIYKSKGKLFSSSTAGDSIPQDIRNGLLLIDKQTKLFICDIKAVSTYRDTVLLNSIELKITD